MATGFNLHRFANPGRFLRLAGAVLPWLTGGAAILFAAGLYLALLGSPPDYQQGDTVRIMYIHVPSAWMAMMGYALLGAAGASALIWRHPLADVASEAIAPVGAAFTFVALVTGSLWGKPTWGTYWVWDARLTSVLILFFLYLGLMALRSSIEDESLASKLTAILALVGIVMLPIIKFSVDFGNTLHQPASVIRVGGPTIDQALLTPLLVMAVGFTLMFLAMHLKAMRNEILRRRVMPDSTLTGEANLLVFPNLDAANITLGVVKTMTDSLHVGPILLGTALPAHILSPSVTSRGVVNMAALAVVEASHPA